MYDCPICGTRHSENPEICKQKAQDEVSKALSKTFEELLERVGDTPAVRLIISNYTIGYMGASFGLHIS